MDGTQRNICIIDDDESVRQALLRLFRSVGMIASAFATAEEFLQRPVLPTPGCIILDINLPGISGLQLLLQLKAEDRQVPVVFITAYSDDRVREQAMRMGAIAFLQKPFEEHALLGAVASAMV